MIMTDLRIRYTKAFIKEALVELLQEKPLNKITVKAVCDKAEINRSTFYKYYADVFDLFEQLEKEYIQRLTSIITSSCPTDFEEILKKITDDFRKDGSAINTIFDYNINQKGKQKLCEACSHFYSPSALGGGGGVKAPNRTDFNDFSLSKCSFEFFFSGCFTTLFSWYRDGMQIPVQNLIEMITAYSKALSLH